MKIDTEPLYVPVKLTVMQKRLAKRLQEKRWAEMILKPQRKGLFSSLISIFTKN